MAGDQIISHCGAQPYGTQCRHDGDETIYNHRNAAGSRPDKSAAHGSQIEASHLGQHVDRISGIRSVTGDRPVDHFYFSGEGGVGQSAAAAGNGCGGRPCEDGQHRGGSGCVSDAHFPDSQNIHAVGLRLFRGLDTDQDRPHSLLPGHRRLQIQIGRASCDAPIDDGIAPVWQLYAYVPHLKIHPEVFAERSASGEALGQIDRLRHRHRLGSGGNAFIPYAVVCGKNKYAPAVHPVVNASRDACDLYGNILQLSQTAGRLGKFRLTFFRPGHGFPVSRTDSGEHIIQAGFRLGFRYSHIRSFL